MNQEIFTVKNDGVKDIYSIEINFINGEQKLVTTFNFVKSPERIYSDWDELIMI